MILPSYMEIYNEPLQGSLLSNQYPYHPCMMHLPTFTINVNDSCRYKYTVPVPWMLKGLRETEYIKQEWPGDVFFVEKKNLVWWSRDHRRSITKDIWTSWNLGFVSFVVAWTHVVSLIPLDQYMGFLKWWYPITMGFPTKNDHFGYM